MYMPHSLCFAVALRLNRITAIILGLLLAIVSNALAQPTLTIGTNTRVVGTGAAQLVYGGGALTNNGSLSLPAGQLSATGPVTYGGSGAAIVATAVFTHSTGNSMLNSLLSVTGRATLSANTALNANGQLYLRTDQFPDADLVNNGILTGTVQGLVTNATVNSGATAYSSQLSTNVSGSSMQYQWQSSADNSQWSNVPGATSATYTANVNTSTYYRCRLTATNSSYDQTTPAVLLTFTGTQPLILTTSAQPNPVNAGSTIALTALASGGTPSYTYAWNAPAGIALSATNTSAVSGTVGAGISGIQTLTVTVTDATMPTSQTISATVSVTVNRVNRPPTAPTYVNQTATVGTPFSYRVFGFTDPDGDPVNYSVSIDPVNGFSFDPGGPTVVGTPIATGVSTVTVTGTDPGNLSTSATFTIMVIPAVLIRYVKTGGTGDGSSWPNASGDLQAMINAPGVQQVWVAGGIFRPTTTESDPRRASFRMKNNVAIYGGFTGTETSLTARPPGNPVVGTPSSTTLSGDIGKPGDNSDNSYHVFYHFYDSQLNGTAVLDGVVITDGNTAPTGNADRGFEGAGMLNLNSSPTLTNCSLVNNSGGGIWNSNSSPTLNNCKLQGNSASSGGGIHNINGSNPTLTNCSLLNNSAANGGGMFSFNSSNPILTNCSLQSNSAILGGASTNRVITTH